MRQPSWHDCDDDCVAIRDGGPADSFTNKFISLFAMAALALVLIGVGLASLLARLAQDLALTAQGFKGNPKADLYLVRLDAEPNRRACLHAQSKPDDKS